MRPKKTNPVQLKQPFGLDSVLKVYSREPRSTRRSLGVDSLGAAGGIRVSRPFSIHHDLSLICLLHWGSVEEILLGKTVLEAEKNKRIWKLSLPDAVIMKDEI